MLLSDRGFESRKAEEMFSSKTPVAVVAPTQRPSQSLPMVFPGVKRPEPEVDRSPSYSVKVKNVCPTSPPPPSRPPLPPLLPPLLLLFLLFLLLFLLLLLLLCLHGKHRDSFVYVDNHKNCLMKYQQALW